MRILFLSLFLLSVCFNFSPAAKAAIAATAAWEVETGGNDSNGGGFDSAISGGTDYSQQASPQVVFNGTTITATTAGASATITITGYTVATTDAGNMLQITGGTNYTAGVYEIISVSTGSNTWTLDRACTTGVGAAMTGNMGGCFLTLQEGCSATGPMVAGNTTWVKQGTYLTTTAIAPVSGAIGAHCIIKGYNATRGDLDNVNNYANFPSIVANNVSISVISSNNSYIDIWNLSVSGGTAATKGLRGLYVTGGEISCINCSASGFTSIGIYGPSGLVVRCYATSCPIGIESNAGNMLNCIATACTTAGIEYRGSGAIINCMAINNTGDGIAAVGTYTTQALILNCVSDSNSGNGMNFSAVAGASVFGIQNCILSNNGTYGINFSGTVVPQYEVNNAFYNNTSGQVSGFTKSASDIVLSSTPYNNPGTDFSLNNNPGGGAACRAAGYPGVFPLANSTGYLDIGAIQSRSAGTAY